MTHLRPRTQQGSVGFKQKVDFSSLDSLSQSCQTLSEDAMDFIDGFILSKTKLPYQNDDILLNRKAW